MNLNIRDFPDELWHKLKLEAVQTGVTLREFVVAKLGGSISTATSSTGSSSLKRSTTRSTGTRKRRAGQKGVGSAEAGTELTEANKFRKAEDVYWDRKPDESQDGRKRDHCPTDRTELVAMGSRAVCPQCGANYPILAQYYYPGT